jgi:hypothetical protein
VPIVNGYCTADEFNAWNGGTTGSNVGIVERAINAASRAIDDYCQRYFWANGTVSSPVTRTFEACDPYWLDLGANGDLVSVTSLATDATGDGVFEIAWAASDYQLLPFDRPAGYPYTSIEAIATRAFPVRHGRTGRRDLVQIVGVWGWAAVPPAVTQACLIKASKLFTRAQSPNGIAGIGEFGPIRISRFEDPDVVDLLDSVEHTSAHGL